MITKIITLSIFFIQSILLIYLFIHFFIPSYITQFQQFQHGTAVWFTGLRNETGFV